MKRLSGILTGPATSPGNLYRASVALYQLFLQLSGLDPDDPEFQGNRQLAQGKALAPVWAAYCLLDFGRTRIFLRGLLGAIQAARQRFPGIQIHVLYAGCGPFASLIVPLIPLLKKHSVAFTLLEISPESLGYLEKIIAAFQLSPWIRDIVLTDATEYQLDKASPVHVLVGEMLQTGLQQEPQVAAMLNLAPQLTTGGFLVPQSIIVQAGLLHPGRNQARMLSLEAKAGDVYTLLEPAFELSQTSIAKISSEGFSEIVVEIPADRNPGFRQLALFTRIRVFEDEWLEPWESVLTQPLILTTLDRENPPRKIGLRYQTGPAPGFNWRIIN
ncbi:MAG: hypothetical protein ABIQ93_12495 [Saprospiraceae bacterium]